MRTLQFYLKKHVLFIILLTISYSSLTGQSIIPLPNNIKHLEGNFTYQNQLTVFSNDNSFNSLIPVFTEQAQHFANLTIVENKKATVLLIRDHRIKAPEGYKLNIEKKKIILRASTNQGCFYGLQSLLQLLIFSEGTEGIPCIQITDAPRYEWRGLMLDESRHFFGMEEVKKILDQMAILKLNRFHWHLTDEPGWRIEIKKYPLLTQLGGVGNYSNPKATAQYYTQEEIKEIVAYAAKRFIQVIPEIDMPGHATAAVKAYPEHSGGGSEKHPDFTFNPGNKATYAFLTDILREVSIIFPSEYIHIGGDEVSFGNQLWPSLPGVKQLMKEQNLSDLKEVEHWFVRQMADSVSSLGKKMIGWDEIMSSGINNNKALTMWWRHDKPKVLQQALDKNFSVILCPRIPLYFDFVQNENHTLGRKWGGKFAPIESVYQFPSKEFLPHPTLSNPNILGIQANVWTETITTKARLEYMIFPRILALSESAWTNEASKNFNDFRKRITMMLKLYRKEHIEYYKNN